MTTYPTLSAARAAADIRKDICCIIEIQHAAEGICYILAKCPLTTLRAAIERTPITDITALIAEYPCRIPTPRTPAQIERDKVSQLYAQADATTHADYYDPAAIVQAQIRAESARQAWRDTYPDAAAAERDADTQQRAADLRRHAEEALSYDADGWISANERQQRHDEYMAQANKIS